MVWPNEVYDLTQPQMEIACSAPQWAEPWRCKILNKSKRFLYNEACVSHYIFGILYIFF